MVIFHSYVNVYQRVTTSDDMTIGMLSITHIHH